MSLNHHQQNENNFIFDSQQIVLNQNIESSIESDKEFYVNDNLDFVSHNNNNNNNNNQNFKAKMPKLLNDDCLNNNNEFIKKRKLSSDSLDSLNDEMDKSLDKIENTSLPDVEAFLHETGLNVQLIAKNDKKLVKLNLNNKQPKIQFDSINHQQNTSTKSQVKTATVSGTNKKTFDLNELDDLPSESDVSSGATLVLPINNSANLKQVGLVPLDKINQNKILSICYKCTKCSQLFNNESLLKSHQTCCLNDDCLIIENELSMFGTSLDSSSLPSSTLSRVVNEKSVESAEEDTNNNKKNSSKASKKRSFICNECGAQLHSQNDLNKHMLQTHESRKPYDCSMCQMTFYDLSSKKRHEKEHSGFKPFRCYICSFEFTRASNLRAHLLKVHPNDIGKCVNITKSIDNKLKFEFNLDEINNQKEQGRQIKFKPNSSSSSISNTSTTAQQNILSVGHGTHSNATPQIPTINPVIYIKDPNNKNSDIQHMVIYVDGKPIFVQNPKMPNSENSSNKTHHQSTSARNKNFQNKEMSKTPKSTSKLNNTNNTNNNNRPVAKIPYLLAAAAAAAASNHRQQQIQLQKHQQQHSRLTEPDYIKNSTSSTISTNNSTNDLKHDQEYLQLVSMFKQKNEKLFNPLLNKNF